MRGPAGNAEGPSLCQLQILELESLDSEYVHLVLLSGVDTDRNCCYASVINLGSIASVDTWAGGSVYCATKVSPEARSWERRLKPCPPV